MMRNSLAGWIDGLLKIIRLADQPRQPDDFSRGGTEAGTEVLTATCQGDPSVELPPGM